MLSVKFRNRECPSASGLASRRILAPFLLGLVAVAVLINVGQVWAQSITPNPPIANQNFTITGTCSLSGGNTYCVVIVYSGPGCTGSIILSAYIQSSGPYQAPVPRQQAGVYSTQTLIQNAIVGEACLTFNIDPASIPEYPYGVGLLAVFMVLGYAVIRRSGSGRTYLPDKREEGVD